jgi:hypothetical protein
MDCYNTWIKPHSIILTAYLAALSILAPIYDRSLIPLLWNYRKFNYRKFKEAALQYFGYFNPETYNKVSDKWNSEVGVVCPKKGHKCKKIPKFQCNGCKINVEF